MARIRTIKPEFWQDEKLAALPATHRLVFLGLISIADDAGRLLDNIKYIDGFLFPLTEESSRDSLETLKRLSVITLYESESGQRLIQIANWAKHQKVNHPSAHVFPGPAANGVGVKGHRKTSPEGRKRVSRNPLASTSTSTITTPRETWLTPFADAWSARCGNPPFGRLAKALAPLIESLGAPETLTRWTRYLEATEPKFCSASRFVDTHVAYVGPEIREMTDDYGRMKLHRKNPAGEWESVS